MCIRDRSEAAEQLQKDKRKTITGDDVSKSMRALGFDLYLEYLDVFVERHRKVLTCHNTQDSIHSMLVGQ